MKLGLFQALQGYKKSPSCIQYRQYPYHHPHLLIKSLVEIAHCSTTKLFNQAIDSLFNNCFFKFPLVFQRKIKVSYATPASFNTPVNNTTFIKPVKYNSNTTQGNHSVFFEYSINLPDFH